MRTRALTIAVVLALAGCDEPANKAVTGASNAATPDTKSALSVSDGRLVLPAVAGNPAAAYFTLVNNGRSTTSVAGIAIEGAETAEIHRTQGGSMAKVDRLEIHPGTEIEFAPGGLHLMVFKLKAGLKPGDTAAMTLNFADGDKLSVPLTVAAPGEGMGDMH